MAPTIRTCSLALALLALLAPASGWAKRDERSALSHYLEARMADTAGEPVRALQSYSAALTAEPDNGIVAQRAYRHAMQMGDRKLAVRAALQMDRAKAMTGDARLLLASERVLAGDWRGATAMVERIEQDGNLGFMAPILRGWIAIGSRDGDPLAPLAGVERGSLTASYAGEHRALLLFAARRIEEGKAAIDALATSEARLVALRLSAAAQLLAARDREGALGLLAGDERPLVEARALVAAGKALPRPIQSPAQGMAQLYARIASDLVRDRAPSFALIMARQARYLDPANGAVMLIEAQALAANRMDAEALALLDSPAMAAPFSGAAAEARIPLLERTGRIDDAIRIANKLGYAPGATLGDKGRLADLLTRAGRHAEAVTVYGVAIGDFQRAGAGDEIPWALWLLHGGALERAGDWPAARASLYKAVALAPNEATPHNHLGYAMLERRENLPEAKRLIMRAAALKPADAAIADSLGWALFLTGEVDKAIDTLERAVATEPNEPTLGEHLGDAYWTAGRRVDARYAWSAALIHAEGDAAKRLDAKVKSGLTPETAAR